MAPRSVDPKLIIRIINIELVQPIRPRYINVTDRQTDRQTDGGLAIAIPRFTLRASRGKNRMYVTECVAKLTPNLFIILVIIFLDLFKLMNIIISNVG